MKCFATTNSFMIDPHGKVKPCCKFHGNFGHINNFNSVDDIINSRDYQKLRESHNNNIFSTGCKACELVEKRNYRSRRLYYDNFYNQDDFLFDISVGTFCNLKCRMCSSSCSSSWIPEEKKLSKMGFEKDTDIQNDIYNISTDEINIIIDFVKKTNKNCTFEIKGGEPLLNPRVKTVLQELSKLDNCKNFSVILVTNGTIKAEWLNEICNNFKNFDLILSADGINEVYDYIRGDKSFNWKQFINNFEHFKKINGASISFNFVIQNYNIHQMLDFYNFARPYPISWLVLQYPVYLQTKLIPEEYKNNIKEKIVELRNILNDNKLSTVIMDNLIVELSSTDSIDSSMYEKFIKYTASLDKLRNQSIFEVAPHLITAKGKEIYDSI